MLNIFYGRENLDKEKFIFEKVGDRALIMVPDQYTLEAERQAFRHLGVSSLMDVEIVSAASLGGNILSELGGNKRSFITNTDVICSSTRARRASGTISKFSEEWRGRAPFSIRSMTSYQR